MNVRWWAEFVFVFGLVVSWAPAAEPGREVIQDNRFQRGFSLSNPKPGKHVRYGELAGAESGPPTWRLLQWSSLFPLQPGSAVRDGGGLVCSNLAKGITIRSGEGLLSLSVNSYEEYGIRARKPSEPWVHLLVEQEFQQPEPITELAWARLRVQARLVRARNLHQNDYSPDAHAAQFQLFFSVQNLNRSSPGYGDLVWFGVPIYDNRDRFPKAFKAQDFGGTAKFIFTPDGRTYSEQSAHDGTWIIIDKDLLPLIREALEMAWAKGFLKGSKQVADFSISGMNMGWELPGTFDAEMQVRGLSLRTQRKTNSN